MIQNRDLRKRLSGPLLTAGPWLVVVLVLAGSCPAAVESFEDGPGLWRSAQGGVTRSSEHWKLGEASLRWEATPGAVLVRSPDDALNQALRIPGGGVKLWLYCPRELDGHLQVRVGGWTFPINLGFRGWRAAWVVFSEDGTAADPVQGFRIESVGTRGTIYLDAVEFGPVPWSRQADDQVPYVNPARAGGAYWMTDQDWWAVAPPTPPETVTERELRAFRDIEQRYERWMFGRLDDPREPVKKRLAGVEALIRNGHRAFEELGLSRRGDTVTGPGAFSGIDVHKPRLAADIFQVIALALAYDVVLNDSDRARQRFLDLIDYAYDQGWAAGSIMGSGYGGQLRVSSYVHAVYILRDFLARQGRLERELHTLSYHLALGEMYAEPEHPGANADDLRTRFLFRLLYVLMQEDAPEKVRDMRCLLRWGDAALSIAPGYGGTIKPDYTVFHHATAYASAYGNNALHMSSLVYWLLHETEFSLSKRVGINLKEALLALRFMGGTYHVPMGVSGRWPFSGAALVGSSPAYAYIADALEDREAGAAFARLWDPAAPEFDRFIGSGSARIYWSTSPGSLPWVLDQAERYEPEPHPSGHRAFPYAAMNVHRRRQWVASARGWSKYVWNYEASAGQNRYGRYSSYGMIQIFGRGDPVNPADSGYREDGWDWRRPPGATVIRVPLERLNESEVIPRVYTDNTFVGGLSLGGRHGIWAMEFRDPHFEPTFTFRKTIVGVGDTLVCLGSDIGNDDAEHPTETVIYQCVVEPSAEVEAVETSGIVHMLMDPAGNGYVFPEGQPVHMRRGQQASMHNSGRRETEGNVEAAWIDHGHAPRNQGYVYAIRPDTSPENLRTYARQPDFRVIRRDRQAHTVTFPQERLTAYAFFDTRVRFDQGPIAGTDTPCLVMTQTRGERTLLAVADPDLRLPERSPATRYAPGGSHDLVLTLGQPCALLQAPPGVRLLDPTHLQVSCRDGASINVLLGPASPER